MDNKLLTKYIFYFLLIFNISIYAEDGIDYYYGIGVEKNYEKSLELFQEDESEIATIFIIIQYLNGYGVKSNPRKALEILGNYTESNDYVSGTMEELKSIIENRIENSNEKYEPVEFSNIAITTYDMNFLEDIANKLKDQEIKNEISKLEKKFNKEQKGLLSLIQKEYYEIEENDASRMYNLYIDGTIRGMAYVSMKSYLKDRELKRIKNFVNNKIIIYTEKDLIEADKKLNEAYKAQKLKIVNNFEEMISIYEDDAETVKYYKDLIDETNLNLKKSQLTWIDYRDNWVKLLKILGNNKNLEISIKTVLTNERIEELEYDSIGMW